MAPFDGPALGDREEHIASDQQDEHDDEAEAPHLQHAGQQARRSRRRARRSSSGRGRTIIMTTCDVDYAAPVVQESINAGKLTVAACIGTDQMGPKRFGPKGRLAFSFGNVAQDEGSAMAEFAWKQGLAERVARDRHRHRLLPQRRPGVQGSLAAARRQDRHRGDVPVGRREPGVVAERRDASATRSRPT